MNITKNNVGIDNFTFDLISDPVAVGDVNQDGVVDIKDVTYLQKYLAKFENFECDLRVCDTTLDKKLNVRDVTQLQRNLTVE